MKGIGIDNDPILYIKNKRLTRRQEMAVTSKAIESIVREFAKKNYLDASEAECQFINYGDTELVYVLSFGERKYTMLVGQPIAPFGAVYLESILLKNYESIDPKTVVAPVDYFSEKVEMFNDTFTRECYITPYHMQARCVASQENGYGVYVPEPYYRFEKFSNKENNIVCACMIAKLISLYDIKRKCGIAACKIGGGDFMLEKGWNSKALTVANTLDNMKLIAAREEIFCSLKDYIEIIKSEFSKPTYYRNQEERDPSILINHKNRMPIGEEIIKMGIHIGLNEKSRLERESNEVKNLPNGVRPCTNGNRTTGRK